MKKQSYFQITIRPKDNCATIIQEIADLDQRTHADVVNMALERALEPLLEEAKVKAKAVDQLREVRSQKKNTK